jgi:flagellar hook-associated protein 2
MAISSPGVGSGLDIQSIVAQLVKLEQRPLAKLQSDAANFQARLSAFGQLKSQIANLNDQAAKLANPTTFAGLTLTSGKASAVSGRITSTSLATPTQFTVGVSRLAQAQSTSSAPVLAGTDLSGTLSISIGNTADVGSFGTAVDVTVLDTDTLSDVARKINEAGAGVTATVLSDAQGERLLVRSTNTGEANGFRITAAGTSDLAQLAFDPFGAATTTTLAQAGLDTEATINGVTIFSANNTFDNIVPGISLTVSEVTAVGAPALITVAEDKAAVRTAINNFVQSYNALNDALAEMTRFNPADKSAGTLQGDATAVGIQNALRRLLGGMGSAGSSFNYLSELGVSFQTDGKLRVDNAKLDAALANPEEVQKFFSATDGATGLAVRLQNFAEGMLSASGVLTGKEQSIKGSIDRNTREQERLADRLSRTEERLLAQYSRLDAQLAQLTALGNYVAQQVTMWNNQSSSRR